MERLNFYHPVVVLIMKQKLIYAKGFMCEVFGEKNIFL